jgi:peptidoglycan/LPS O-acetylase OafA/YrhL
MPFSWRDNDISFLSALWDGLVGVFVVQSVDASLNSPLWTIYYEMIGSVIVYALLALIGKDSRRPYVYPLLILIFANTNFIGFIVGLILADLYCNRQGVFKFITNLALPYKLVGLSLAITFASFPPLRTATTTSLVHQPLLFLTQNYTLNATILYLAAAVIIILLLLTSRRLNKLMELRPIVSLGSASYSLYATHLIVLGSIGSFAFFILTKKYGLPYNYSAAITFVTYVISALIVASIFRKYVDSRSIYLSQLVGQIIRNKAVNTKTKQKEGVEDYQLVRVNDPIS